MTIDDLKKLLEKQTESGRWFMVHVNNTKIKDRLNISGSGMELHGMFFTSYGGGIDGLGFGNWNRPDFLIVSKKNFAPVAPPADDVTHLFIPSSDIVKVEEVQDAQLFFCQPVTEAFNIYVAEDVITIGFLVDYNSLFSS